MSIWSRFKAWLTGERLTGPVEADVNKYANSDTARRAMYPELSDEQYNRRFHPNEPRGRQ